MKTNRANKIAKRINKLSGINVFENTRKIKYVKVPNTSKGEIEEIEVNYFLNNDNIKEILKTKKILRKVSL